MLRPLRLALGVAAAVAALAPAAQARVPKDFIGITSEDVFAGSSSYRQSNLSAQRSRKIGITRQTFDWSSIETSRGHYELGAYDSYVADLAQKGMEVLPVLFNAPRFHQRRRGHAISCQPTKSSAMAKFARVLVRRYGPRGSLWRERKGLRKLPIRSWQIWNEPTLIGLYWCGKKGAAKKYVRLLGTVGRAIKKVDRRAEIVTAGLPPSKLRLAIPLARFLKQIYRAKAKRYFDTLAINSYAKNAGELGRLLKSVRRVMRRYHDRAKIWITEIGWGDKGVRHRFVVGARGQARRITSSLRYIRKARRRLRLRGFIYFCWRDAKPYPPKYNDMWGLHTGLLTLSGGHKPAYAAFRKGVRRLR